jgi:hypothetical protein
VDNNATQWHEPPEAAERRQRHERELEKAGGPSSDAGQALLERWHQDDINARRQARPIDGRHL